MLIIRLTVSPEWKSGEIKAIKKGRGAKRIVANQSLFHRNLEAVHLGRPKRLISNVSDQSF